MKYIDTHIHVLDLSAKELKNLIESEKITNFIGLGAKHSEWEVLAHFYGLYQEFMTPAFGVHPWYISELEPGWQQHLELLLQKFPNALVGEIGLDRLKNPDSTAQFEVFATQLELARRYSRPVLIHAVRANEWLENFWDQLPEKFVIHSYSGRKEFLKRIIAHNGYVSFSPSVTKLKDHEALINMVPADRLLIETDAPYQGEIDDLYDVSYTINMARQEDMTKQLYHNAKVLLNV